MKKGIKVSVKILLIAALVYFFPRVMICYLVFGLYDVSRNRPFDLKVAEKYFLDKGLLLWLLSPLNILFDLLALPYINKGVYQLSDLPKGYQEEIRHVIDVASQEDVIGKIEQQVQSMQRGMIFFKWYLKNLETSIPVPEFHQRYQYITTIGVSVFNKKVSTSAHFGPFRPSLRVLYNINDMTGKDSYIHVGNVDNFWSERKLFIFDDTLLHQSFNNTDKIRYCLFVDVVRPSYMPGVFRFLVRLIHLFLSSVNLIFYKNWEKIR